MSVNIGYIFAGGFTMTITFLAATLPRLWWPRLGVVHSRDLFALHLWPTRTRPKIRWVELELLVYRPPMSTVGCLKSQLKHLTVVWFLGTHEYNTHGFDFVWDVITRSVSAGEYRDILEIILKYDGKKNWFLSLV